MALSAQNFEQLLKANRILSSQLNLENVLRSVFELATNIVEAEASSILLLDEQKQELYFDMALGGAGDVVKEIRLKVGEGIAGWVAAHQKPVVVNDPAKDDRFSQRADKTTNFQTRSILAVPLISKGRFLGVVEAINKKSSDGFTNEDLEIFEIFAGQAAVAIENARLFSAVQVEKDKLNTVFGEMKEGVVLLDHNGRAILINEAAGRFLGLKGSSNASVPLGPELFPDFETFLTWEQIKDVGSSNESFEINRKKGKELYLQVLVHRLGSQNDKRPHGFLMILRDITEEHRGERLKRNFLSLISHKLKTPLTVIVGYAPTLTMQPEGLNPLQLKALKAIEEQATNLGGLVDKLLRYTVVESENLNANVGPVSLGNVLDSAINTMELLGSGKEVKVNLEPSGASLPNVMVDEALATEVFKNLIENSVKFNKKDEKEVSVRVLSENGRAQILVKDNGPGIPPEEREKVFQKFYQIEESFTGQVPGAGLGLAFCRRVVEAMGGAISLDSKMGEGTTITVELLLSEDA